MTSEIENVDPYEEVREEIGQFMADLIFGRGPDDVDWEDKEKYKERMGEILFPDLPPPDVVCKKCHRLAELYERTPQEPREYWLMTEIFVMLHGGDVCEEGEDEET